jgi:hypothetical protein
MNLSEEKNVATKRKESDVTCGRTGMNQPSFRL